MDCIFVSGSTRIVKVVNYKRRKRMLVFEAKEVEQVGKIGSETFEKWYSSPGIKKLYATPNKYIEGRERKKYSSFSVNTFLTS